MLRWLFSPESAFPIETLPDEVLLQICGHLRKQDLLSLCETDRYLRGRASDNALWAHLYRRDFGPLFTNTEAKLQYAAAWLYQQASECGRPDIAQIRFRKLFTFLKQHTAKPWAQFYLGMMHYYGQGAIVNTKIGRQCLLISSLECNDYRSAIVLVTLMKKGELQHRFICHKSLHTCLQQAWENGLTDAALALSYLHEKGLGVSQDSNMAATWLINAMQANEPAAVTEYVRLLKDAEENDEHNMNLETELRNLLNIFKDNIIICAEIHYQLGLHYHETRRYRLRNNEFILAANLQHFAASHKLGNIHLQKAKQANLSLTSKRDHLEIACDYFRPGFQQNHRDCTNGLYEARFLLLDTLKIEGDDDAIFSLFRESIRNGNMNAAILISYQYQRNTPRTLLLADPEKIWFLQLSAQAGHAKSLESLTGFHTSSPSPFVSIALGIIYLYGISGSKSVAASSVKANNYFNLAETLEPGSIEIYLQAGRQLGILPEEIETLLATYCKPDKHNNACIMQ